MNSFDIDGVIYISAELGGIFPGPHDVIITGRSFEEAPETIAMLTKRGISNYVYFNPLPFAQKTRVSSGEHKARILNNLREQGIKVGIHFEDDPIQAQVIADQAPHVAIVLLQHDLTERENVRHPMPD